MPAICFDGVHKQFGELHALRGVSLDIQKGAFFGLLGPNGAGKSTLINIMAGLVRATRGQISVMGHDVVRDYRRSRSALGIVPQELVYDPFFSVREMLRLQSGFFGHGPENHAWIDELLETLELTDKRDVNLMALSGGMKRRVLIAHALVHRPPVVVLDEPTAGVDVELRKVLWHFTQRLHAQGHTIVLTTHYLEEAEALCERIAILHQGQLVAVDTKDALLTRHPYREFCLTLEGDGARFPATLEAQVVSRNGDQVVLRMHHDQDHIGDVLDVLRGVGLRVIDIHTRESRLEDVFLELTGRVAVA